MTKPAGKLPGQTPLMVLATKWVEHAMASETVSTKQDRQIDKLARLFLKAPRACRVRINPKTIVNSLRLGVCVASWPCTTPARSPNFHVKTQNAYM